MMINNIMWIEKAYSLSSTSSPHLSSGNIVMFMTNNENVH